MIRICAISDLHEYLPEIEPCDILCICGDISHLNIEKNFIQSQIWYETKFFPWINHLPARKIFMIAGNHDFYLEYYGKDEFQHTLNFFLWRENNLFRRL